MVSPYFLWAVASASHQNQRAHHFTCGGRFLRWFVCCLSHQRWLQLASTLCVLGGIYKVALCVRLYNESVQPRTWSVYGCRKATEVRQLHDCSTCHPANFNFLGFPSLSCNFFCFHEFICNIFDTYDSLSRMLCDPRDFLQLHVNFLFYFHANSYI